MPQITRAYLRASTDEQDASRARQQVEQFASEHGLLIVGWFIENESGSRLQRPELFRLLRDSQPGDVLLCEQVDRLSRLSEADWRKLWAEIDAKQVRVVALDLPTSWQMATTGDDSASDSASEFTRRMFAAINSMLLDMLAAVARKDYEDRRRRQFQGQARAKLEGKYRGRPEDVERNAGIAKLLKAGLTWSDIQSAVGCSRATVARAARRVHAEEAA
jgi:DNA invertase Pin-like site-specific DNA recombinase